MRGRFDINNPSSIAEWCAVWFVIAVCSQHAVGRGSGSPKDYGGIRSTHTALVKINYERIWGRKMFVEGGIAGQQFSAGNGAVARVTDILRASALTDESPYLADTIDDPLVMIWPDYASPLMVDEQDMERLPQQMLSLLRRASSVSVHIFTTTAAGPAV